MSDNTPNDQTAEELKNQITKLENRIELLNESDPEEIADLEPQAEPDIVAGGLSLRARAMEEQADELRNELDEITNEEEKR